MAVPAAYALGLDFGTNSVRALIVNVRDGQEAGTAVAPYPSGEAGVILDSKDPNLARQNPADYAVSMARAVRAAIRAAGKARGFSADRIAGIGVDTTASTPLPIDETVTPLALQPRLRSNPAAGAWLWKDHTSHAEAEEITNLARVERPEYLAGCGGVYSSEWFWAKILRCTRTAPKVAAAAASWIELCDYIPALLTGCESVAEIRRGVCAAGHKAMWHPGYGLPSADFLGRLDPGLAQLRSRLYEAAVTSDQPGGSLTGKWARALGLREGIPVAVGMIDAHAGAVGAGIHPGRLVKILGTSSCDMAIVPGEGNQLEVPGLCGVVHGSIVPGYFGIEAGQPAVGDLFNWFAARFDRRRDAHERLTVEAARLRPGESGLIALDWNHGNRSVLVDVRLTGLLLGQTLHTTPAEVYRTLIEASAFGARMILERMAECGIGVREIVNCGGIAEKNALLMQIYADVTGCSQRLSRSAQTCALGAAICGAVAAGPQRGGHASFERAQKAMCGLKATTYRPRAADRVVYDRLFAVYRELHDAFGHPARGCPLEHIMKNMLDIRDGVRRAPRMRRGPRAAAGR